MNAALLILDAQNDFFGEDNPRFDDFLRVVPAINEAIAFFRERRWPVIFIQHTSSQKPEGSHDWAIYSGFDIQPGDIRLSKYRQDAFCATDLDMILSSHDVDTVVLAGYVAERCVVSTYRGAVEEGYRAVILREATASWDEELAGSMVDKAWEMPSEEMRTYLGSRVTGEILSVAR